MAAITLKSVRGTEGEVTVPSLGLLIATMYKWSLTRREEYGPNQGAFTLRAAFSYLNPMFQQYWDDKGMRKQTLLRLNRNHKGYRLNVLDTSVATIEEHQMIIEGVELWPIEEQQP